MKRFRHEAPQINAGSMADIAFLLLIFFLVTAMIPKDIGFQRKLPKLCPDGQDCSAELLPRNVLELNINSNNELMVENEIIELSELKGKIIDFLDNNGKNECNYCQGNQLKSSSDHPDKAIISLRNDHMTSYEFYIQVQDELTQAYYTLRKKYAQKTFGKAVDELTPTEMKQTRDAYPFKLSEAETRLVEKSY